MRTIVLISCGKTKLKHRAPAGDLYTGSLFRKSLAYARRRNPDAIFILSALHGLLELSQEIDPYEKTLHSMTSHEVSKWAEQVLAQLRLKADLRSDLFVLLAGKKYRSQLVSYFHHSEVPLEGLRFGQQLKFLGSTA